MLRYGIPSYKLEKDLLAAEIDVIRQLGVEIRCGVEVGKRRYDRRPERARDIKDFMLRSAAREEENRESVEKMPKVHMRLWIS